MYISKLSLYGFKSFYRKSEIEFDRGITAIVGPNGCGKSNIVDAIRWVMGEQKPTVLRVDKNVDVIFNGTESRKPLNVAEVSLVVHNESGRIPIALSDIVITRRLFRNGESEYLINNHLCRLKDINDLFIDTGMGADAYSIIELKMIENILSENPDERRRLFEEAAGINKYRIQRKTAIRKLETTENDLLRLNDVIQEVESKVRKLKAQLRKYERYQDYTKRLIEAEILLTARRIIDIRTYLEPLRDSLAELRLEREKLDKEILELERASEENQKALSMLEEESTSLMVDRDELLHKKNDIEKEQILMEEQLRNLDVGIEREKKALHDLKYEIERRERDNLNFQARVKDLKEIIETNKVVRERKEKQLEQVKDRYEELNRKIQELRDREFALVRTKGEAEERIKNLQENIDTRLKENEDIGNKLKAGQSDLEKVSEKIKRISEEVVKLQNGLGNHISALNQEKSRFDKLVRNEEKLVRKLNGTKIEISGIKDRIKFYEELIDRTVGVNDLFSKVLKRQSKFEGIKGALFDLIEIDKKYHNVIETVVEDLDNILIVEDYREISAAIRDILNSGKGRLRLIPLRGLREKDSRKISDRRLVPLRELVSYTAEIEPVVEALFGNVYLCSDEEFDSLVGRKEYEGIGFVTTSGKYRRADSTFVITKSDDRENILIGRKITLNRLGEKLEVLNHRLEAQQSELDELRESKKTSQIVLKQLNEKINTLEEKLKKSSEELKNLQIEKSKISSAIEVLKENKVNNEVAIESFSSRLKKEKEIVFDCNAKIAELESELKNLEEEFSKVSSVYESINKEISDSRIKLVNLENELENYLRRLDVNARFLDTSRMKIGEFEERIKQLGNKRRELAERIGAKRTTLMELDSKYKELQSTIDEKSEKIERLKEEVAEINMRLYKLRHRKEEIADRIARVELEIKEYEARENELRAVVREKYKSEVDIEKVDREVDEEVISRNIERYRRELENLGSINLGVREEYESESERLRFLKQQRNDLVKSEGSLREIISEIDKIAREQYLRIFEKIQGNFRETFATFFGGGVAELKLEGANDPLEARVEVYACPGGKRLQSLKMLSSGEKALTAIALLFAIYQVKPSPFCILDEVDAPLDDENIRRFTTVIKSFATSTQFIIVTHNKLTMSIADVLYGVTMPEKGVSQIVSVKLK